MAVCPSEYPQNLLWEEKVFSMPNIPRGDNGLLFVLREILTRVRDHADPGEVLVFKGSSSRITLDEACVRLRPMHFVSKTASGWELTEESVKWLDSDDELYLAAMLCANIRFVSELLYYLDTPRKSQKLKEIAIREYGMAWKTLSDVNSRLVWLRQLGMVDYQEFSLLYSITDKGRAFLRNVQITEPNQLARQDDDTNNEEALDIGEWVKAHCTIEQEQLAIRRQTIGYIPGLISECGKTIAEYLNLIKAGTTYEGIRNYAAEKHGISASSVRSFMTTLTNMGFVKRQSDELYVITGTAENWLASSTELELICIIHRNFLYVLEMLQELNGSVMDYKELYAIAKVSYGMDKANIEEIRKRVSILKAAKLIRNVSTDKFAITNRGRMLLNEFPVQSRKLVSSPRTTPDKFKTDRYDALLAELRVASRDSMNPDRFERILKSAFELLGFKATHLGCSGKTDILIQTPGSSKSAYSVAVDAKSTASGSISTGMVDFDSLKEHRRKHQTDYSLIVGCSFQNESLIKRAIEHNVVLLDVDSLEALIKNHLEVPVKLCSYRRIFEKAGLADITLIDGDRQEIIRYGQLMHEVMNCLIEESEDPITEGFLFERDIYRSLRNSTKLAEPPTIDAISSMLQFLSSPLIGCVEKTRDGYYATGSLADVSRKFAFYSRCCTDALI